MKNKLSPFQTLSPRTLPLISRVGILCVSWRVKTLKRGKTHGPLLLEVWNPMEANILVQEGLLHDGELKDCELFIEDCTMTQCYRCYHYGHAAHTCKGKRNCGHCAKEHASNSCPTYNNPATHSCCNCKCKDTAWSRLCPERAARASRAAAAYAARPSLYKIPAKFCSDLSCPPPPPPLPQPNAPQTQPTPTQATGLVRNPAPINGKRARANSNSHAQTNPKKNCAPSSSTSLVLHSTASTASQPTPPPPSQTDAHSRLRPRSLCIMKSSNIACPTSPQL